MIFMASKFSYFIRTLRVVFSVWKKVVDKTYWNATAKTNILGFALLVQHAKIGVISFLKVKNYKPVSYPFMLWNRFTGINAQKELEVMIKKAIKPELIQYALNYILIQKWTCLLNIPWLLIDANLFDQFFWLTSKQYFKNSVAVKISKSKDR